MAQHQGWAARCCLPGMLHQSCCCCSQIAPKHGATLGRSTAPLASRLWRERGGVGIQIFRRCLKCEGLQWELCAQCHNLHPEPPSLSGSQPLGLAQSLPSLQHTAPGDDGRVGPGWGGEPTFPSGICNTQTIEQSVTTVYRKKIVKDLFIGSD